MGETREELKKQRDDLQKKLTILSEWAEKDIKSSIHSIAKKRATKFDKQTQVSFKQESKSENIEDKITQYFGPIMLMNAPSGVLDALTTAEVHYYNLLQNPSIDGLAVVSAYHKALDAIIESYITK